VQVEYRWAEGHYDRLPRLAADLVRRQVTVIAANTPAVPVAKAATTTIPIVFQTGGDPVAAGFVTSLSRPGGNLTGVSNLNMELGPKRLELLHQMVPLPESLPYSLIQPIPLPSPPPETYRRRPAPSGCSFMSCTRAPSATSIGSSQLCSTCGHALVIGPDGFFNSQSEQLALLTVRHTLPAIYQYREFAAAGGLMSYGGSIADSYRTVGVYTGRILKGEKPADLPVQQSTKVELFINLKTAKAIDLTVPLPLLGRADEVIE
jgi:putative ABC transport system substrate-binding protein